MYHGDIRLGETIDIKFCTVTTTGAPTQLAGTPVVSAYPGNSTTQITAGITLTVDFDTVTGLNNVRVVATSGNGYATATNYTLVITTGTVGGTSVVGYCIGSFSIEARSALMPTTAARTLDVSAGGEAGVDWANVGSPTTAVNLSATNIDTDQVVASVTGAVGSVTGNVGGNVTGSVGTVASGGISEASFATTAGTFHPLGIVDQGTAQSATGTTLVLRAAAAFADDEIIGATILITGGSAGVGQSRTITDYVSATDTATVEAWTTTPTGTITYKIFATAPSSGGGGLDAAGVRAAVGLAAANLDTQLAAIDDFLDTEVAAILADTNELQTDWANGGRLDLILDARASQASVDTIDNFLDTEVAAILADTNELQTDWANGGRLDLILDARASQASVDDLPTAAEVNAEVVDALATDTYAEPGQGTPAATATLAAKIGYVYKAWRNRSTQTASEYALYGDDGVTKDQEAAVSDDGTTLVKGEVQTGA